MRSKRLRKNYFLKLAFWRKIFSFLAIFSLVAGYFFVPLPKFIPNILKPPEIPGAQARYQWDPSGGSLNVGSPYPTQDALANVPSWRAAEAREEEESCK